MHPLQIYFLLASALVGIIALRLLSRKHFDGQVVLTFLLQHEGSKALLEFLRVPYQPAIQITSAVVAGVAGVILAVAVLRRHRA